MIWRLELVKSLMRILYNILQPEKIDAVTEQRWLAELALDKQQAIQRHRHRDDRLRSLAGLQLLKCAMQQQGYDQFALSEIDFPEHGKPTIPYPVDFSISHSDQLACCVVSQQGAVGLDVERLREVNPALGRKYLFDDNTPHDNLTLLQHWTCKEAVLKACGEGLRGKLQAITITHDQSQLLAHYHAQTWYLYPLLLPTEYIAHLACASTVTELQLEDCSLV